jgi:transposase
MDCRHMEFSPTKSEDRITRALGVFPNALLMRLLAFALHLLGLNRRAVATLVGMPEESVKTVVRVAMRDGFPALRDRRRSDAVTVPKASTSPPRISARRENEQFVVEFGSSEMCVSIPVAFQVQARTVLLSLVNGNLLSVPETAAVLGIHASHCRELARKLSSLDVVDALVDKRHGQKQDYVVGPEQKAEIIQQLAARAITGRSTSSDVLAEVVNERTQVSVSARTVRWHIQKLGLTQIAKTLPELVETLKKTHSSCS